MTRPVLLFRFAVATLVATILIFVWTFRGALVLEAVPLVEAHGEPEPAVAPDDVASAPVETVLAAARRDPFDPERRTPVSRFAFAGPAPAAPAAASTPEPRLVGTALLPGGRGFALWAGAGEPARIVHLGESVNGWVLERVRPGEADFRTPAGDSVTLTVLEPRP